jgi:hypothetical protein
MSLMSEDADPSENRAAARAAAANPLPNRGMYSVISATGLILRRGHELDRVLLAIDRKLAVV